MKEIEFSDLQTPEFMSKLAHASNYLAMYSTWYDGYTRDPRLMMIPIDDHMVHRGDAVFEAYRTHRGKLFDFEPHMQRLQMSLDQVAITCPLSFAEIEKISLELMKLTQVDSAQFRLYVSRGPGSFTPNPYESIGAQVYLVISKYVPLKEEVFAQGVKVMVSQVAPKPEPFCRIKSCNYLPNVMMKKEALDNGKHFSIGIDKRQYVTEGATENVLFVDKDNHLWAPRWDAILKGTTLLRVMNLAEELVKAGKLNGVGQKDFRVDELQQAKEIMMCGTTIEVLPVVEFSGHKIGGGLPGEIAQALRAMLHQSLK